MPSICVDGVWQGALFPGITVIWSQWAPPLERSRLAMVSYTGIAMQVLLYRYIHLLPFYSHARCQKFNKAILFYRLLSSLLPPLPSKLVTAFLRVVGVTAGLTESNGSLPPGLWLTSPAGWLPRTRISSGTLRWVLEYGLPLHLQLMWLTHASYFCLQLLTHRYLSDRYWQFTQKKRPGFSFWIYSQKLMIFTENFWRNLT